MSEGLPLQLILAFATCGLLYLARHQEALSPLRMFLYGWLAVLGAAVSGLVVYGSELAPATTLLVLGSIIAFAAGTYAAPKYPGEDRPFGQTRHRLDRFTQMFLVLLAMVAAVTVLNTMRGHGLALLENFSTMAGVQRNGRWQEFNSGEIEYGPVRSIGIASCLALATLLPPATKQHDRPLQIAAAICAVVVVADSLLSVGRFNVGVLAACLLVSASLTYGTANLRRIITVRRLIVGIPLAVYFLIIFPVQRSQYLAASAQRALRSNGSDFPDWVVDVYNTPGMGWFEIFAFSSSYFSGALNKLNYFVTETDVFSWYKLGWYNIPQFSQALGAVEGGVTPWHQIRLDIAAVLGAERWSLNPWATGIRDLGIDFGWVTIPLIFVLGYLAQTVYNKSIASRSYVGLIAASYISVSCLLFGIISPFQIRILSNGLWLLGALALIHWIVAGKGRVTAAPRPTAWSKASLEA